MPRPPGKKNDAGKKTAQGAPNRLRIIGGRWRGSRIVFPPLAAIRPSPDRVRETLFNWLQQPIVGARCLDLFAGSGALGLEALSRGAAHVTFVDREPQVGRHLSQTLERLGSRDATVVVEDAQRFLLRPPQPFDIVFLDPPFDSAALEQAGSRLQQGWLAAGAYIYVECAADRPLSTLPAQWGVQRTKRAGQVGYHLLRANPAKRGSAMTGALYPGTFDPITNGHHDLVRRAVDIFGHVLVAIAANPGKAPLFSVDERVELAREVLRDIPNVEVTGYNGLTVDFARQHGLHVVVRGLRAVSDFEFEFQLATMSRHLSNQVDYVFLTPADRFNFISSSLVREIASFGGNVSQFVHPVVETALQRAWARRKA